MYIRVSKSCAYLKKKKSKDINTSTDTMSSLELLLTVALGEKSGFQKMENLLETTRNRDISSFPVVSIAGNPYVISTRFPHLETVNQSIPPRFPELETCGKPHKWFPRVSTPGNSQPEDSTWFPRIGNFRKSHRWF